MVTITEKDDKIVFELKGMHKVWALKDTITVRRKNILRAYQDPGEITFWKGLRSPGTEIPGIIAAGSYYKNGWNFWDVTNKKNTVIVELENENYKKLFIDVENPVEALALLQTK